MTYTLRCQDFQITDCTLDNIKEFTDITVHDEEGYEFIVLSASEEINGISFLQARRHKDNIIFQAGIKIDGKPEVMETIVSKRKCYRFLRDYFLEQKTPDLTNFTLMKRM